MLHASFSKICPYLQEKNTLSFSYLTNWAITMFIAETVYIKHVMKYHVTYAFQSESTLYSCLNVKELLARSRREI